MRVIEKRDGYLNLELSPGVRVTQSDSDGVFFHWPNGGCAIGGVGDSLTKWLDGASQNKEQPDNSAALLKEKTEHKPSELPKIEPCPFCFSTRVELHRKFDYVECLFCGAKGHVFDGHPYDAIVTWNRVSLLSQVAETADS